MESSRLHLPGKYLYAERLPRALWPRYTIHERDLRGCSVLYADHDD